MSIGDAAFGQADATICCDVLEWDYKVYPVGSFDVVWASPPCETFSSVRRSNIGRNGYTRESIERDMLERKSCSRQA